MPLPLLLQCHVHDQSERRMNNRDDVDEEAIATYCYILLRIATYCYILLHIATVSVHGSKCVLLKYHGISHLPTVPPVRWPRLYLEISIENLQVTGGVFQMTNTDNVPETPI